MVRKLDRLGRSLQELIATITDLHNHNIIQERTQAGLQAARARRRNGGRPTLLNLKKRTHAQALYNEKTSTIAQICKTLGFSRATLYRSIQARREE